LRDAHLVGHVRRRMRDFPDEEPPISDGIPVIHGSGKRKALKLHQHHRQQKLLEKALKSSSHPRAE
jgi:hypothetical protein